jgi:hypothetical protein
MSADVTIKGLQAAQDANARAIAAVKPTGALGKAVQFVVAEAHRAAVTDTAVDTGAWRSSHRMALHGSSGRVFLAPHARNPRSGTPVHVYASIWEQRGGRLAVYKNVALERGPGIVAKAQQLFIGELP